MQVIIDGVNYVPMPKNNESKDTLEYALSLRFNSDAGDNLSIRDYLYKLLDTLWKEEEGFSGKRPFGNSGWMYELYTPLVKNDIIEGTLDENGYIDDLNYKQANGFVSALIAYVFYGKETCQE